MTGRSVGSSNVEGQTGSQQSYPIIFKQYVLRRPTGRALDCGSARASSQRAATVKVPTTKRRSKAFYRPSTPPPVRGPARFSADDKIRARYEPRETPLSPASAASFATNADRRGRAVRWLKSNPIRLSSTHPRFDQ